MTNNVYKKTLKKTWDKLGKMDPFWSVLTNKKPNLLDITEFMEIGNKDVESILSTIVKTKTEFNPSLALDYGCGVGRLSQAISKKFKKVIALDISDSMIDVAKKLHNDQNNISFKTLSDLPLNHIDKESVDFVVSLITLQHIRIYEVKNIFTDLYSALKSGGVLVFNLPSNPKLPGFLVSIIRRLRHFFRQMIFKQDFPFMEMNYWNKDNLIKFLTKLGFKILKVEDDKLSPLFRSYRYFLVKK